MCKCSATAKISTKIVRVLAERLITEILAARKARDDRLLSSTMKMTKGIFRKRPKFANENEAIEYLETCDEYFMWGWRSRYAEEAEKRCRKLIALADMTKDEFMSITAEDASILVLPNS